MLAVVLIVLLILVLAGGFVVSKFLFILALALLIALIVGL